MTNGERLKQWTLFERDLLSFNLDSYNQYLRLIFDLLFNFLQSAIPEDALSDSWKRSSHNLWVNRLRRVSSLREFLQVMNIAFIIVFFLICG